MRRALTVACWTGLAAVALAQSPSRTETPPPRIEVSGESKKEAETAPKAGTIILKSSGEWDRVADEAGQLYLSRGYKGVVPGVRDEPAVPSKARKAAAGSAPQAPVLNWVGFQPFATYSRVFLQVAGTFSFTVTKPRSDLIEVLLPGARAATPNDQRHLVTREFPTVVDRVLIEERDGSTVVRIVLKGPAGYLYRQEGAYLFVDVSL